MFKGGSGAEVAGSGRDDVLKALSNFTKIYHSFAYRLKHKLRCTYRG